MIYVSVGNTLHGDVSKRASTLLGRGVRVSSAALQLVGVRAAPRALEGRVAGA